MTVESLCFAKCATEIRYSFSMQTDLSMLVSCFESSISSKQYLVSSMAGEKGSKKAGAFAAGFFKRIGVSEEYS